MSIVRTVIVVAVVITLLPSDKGKQQQLYAQAVAAAENAATYCDRNAETCTKGRELWEAFKSKAEFAGAMAVDAIKSYAASGISEGEEGQPEAASLRGTLTPQDLEPRWRGPRKQGI